MSFNYKKKKKKAHQKCLKKLNRTAMAIRNPTENEETDMAELQPSPEQEYTHALYIRS